MAEAYIRKHDQPGGDCIYTKCLISEGKRAILPGMILVKTTKGPMHGNCATRAGIKFKVPERPRITRGKAK